MSKNVQINNLSNLLEIQKSSFCWFLSEGLAVELNKFSHKYSLKKNEDLEIKIKKELELKICGHKYKLAIPKLTPSQVKEKTGTYSVQLYILISLTEKTYFSEL